MARRGRCRSQFRGPPGVVQGGAVVIEDHHLGSVRVELQAVFPHPVGHASHAFMEAGAGGVGIFGEGEDELSVVGVCVAVFLFIFV